VSGKARLLLVEDDPAQREPLARFVAGLGHDVATAATLAEARACLERGGVDAVVCDLRLPDGDGLALLRWARARHPLADFLVVTAHGSVETAVDAMREGAHDFLTKPVDLGVLEQRLARLLEKRRLAHEVRTLTERARERIDVAGIVAESESMQQVLATVRRVAPTDSTVLVTGESGTGKELVAELLHRCSPRRDGPFVRVNCGALAETLLETEMFGHVRGAFTGADRDRTGLFVEAGGGTILLDEIGEVSPAMQVRLLRVLQEREVLPVGGSRPLRIDVRVVAATNRDLAREVRAGRFRRDLLFRLNAIEVRIPPLAERREDTAAFVPILLRRCAEELGVTPKRLSREAHDALLAHPFPGNVRELQNVLYRASVLCPGDVISAADLAGPLLDDGDEDAAVPEPSPERPLAEVLAQIERRAMERALARHGGVQARAARSLGMHPRVFRYKARQYGLAATDPSLL
jgi:DNA-binding NtrC family response regulator